MNEDLAKHIVRYLAEHDVDAHLSGKSSVAIDIPVPGGWIVADLTVNGLT